MSLIHIIFKKIYYQHIRIFHLNQMQANREEIISQADNNAQRKDDKKSTINLHVVFWLLLPKIKMMILLRANYENKSVVNIALKDNKKLYIIM